MFELVRRRPNVINSILSRKKKKLKNQKPPTCLECVTGKRITVQVVLATTEKEKQQKIARIGLFFIFIDLQCWGKMPKWWPKHFHRCPRWAKIYFKTISEAFLLFLVGFSSFWKVQMASNPHYNFARKQVGDTRKRGKPEMRSSCRNSLDLHWSPWPRPGRRSASVPHLRYLSVSRHFNE